MNDNNAEIDKINKIKKLLETHNDYSKETSELNYELVKAIRVILGLEPKK